MLDLKEMEKRLDDALAKETEESLTMWLLKKRHKNYFSGNGKIEFLVSSKSRFILKSESKIKFNEINQDFSKNNPLLEAA